MNKPPHDPKHPVRRHNKRNGDVESFITMLRSIETEVMMLEENSNDPQRVLLCVEVRRLASLVRAIVHWMQGAV